MDSDPDRLAAAAIVARRTQPGLRWAPLGLAVLLHALLAGLLLQTRAAPPGVEPAPAIEVTLDMAPNMAPREPPAPLTAAPATADPSPAARDPAPPDPPAAAPAAADPSPAPDHAPPDRAPQPAALPDAAPPAAAITAPPGPRAGAAAPREPQPAGPQPAPPGLRQHWAASAPRLPAKPAVRAPTAVVAGTLPAASALPGPAAQAAPQPPAVDAPEARAEAEAQAEVWGSAMAAWLREHRLYPDAARREGVEGRVVVRFTIDGAGLVTTVTLIASSGSALLDGAAEALLRGAHLPPPPRPGPDHLSVTLPIRYTLAR